MEQNTKNRLKAEAKAFYQKAMNRDNEILWMDPDVIVMVVHPEGDNALMRMRDLVGEFAGHTDEASGELNLMRIPDTEKLFCAFIRQKSIRRKGRIFFRSPAIILGIDEVEGEVVSPALEDLYVAGCYFENAMATLQTRTGKKIPVFCFEEGGIR